MDKMYHRVPRCGLRFRSGFFSRPGMVFDLPICMESVPSDSGYPPPGGLQNMLSKSQKMNKMYQKAVTPKREVVSKKAGEKFLPYLWTFESATNRDGAGSLSPRKYSILSLAIFSHFLFNVSNAPGRRVGWAPTKIFFAQSKRAGSQLYETFDQIEIGSVFAECGALK